MLPKKPSSAQRHKVQIFWEAHKNLWKLPLFSKCTNHDEDFVKIFVLLRKSEFWNYKFHLNCLEHSISHCYTNRLILGPSLVLCSSLSTLQSFTGKSRKRRNMRSDDFRRFLNPLPTMSNNFYYVTSDFFWSFWTPFDLWNRTILMTWYFQKKIALSFNLDVCTSMEF